MQSPFTVTDLVSSGEHVSRQVSRGGRGSRVHLCVHKAGLCIYSGHKGRTLYTCRL